MGSKAVVVGWEKQELCDGALRRGAYKKACNKKYFNFFEKKGGEKRGKDFFEKKGRRQFQKILYQNPIILTGT